MTWKFFTLVLPLFLATAAHADDSFSFRLSPGPRLVGTRAESSGNGQVTATLKGNRLSLKGTYDGLLGAPTSAQLMMGVAPGVRGPKIADLIVSPAASGTVDGDVQLGTKQLAAFHKGGLYVEIDSAVAPDGDLWGWILPLAE